MRIFDQNGNELNANSVDHEKGRFEKDRLFVCHHEAIEAVEEVFHYEYTVFPNGGKERNKIIDVEAVEAVDAWDEYEDILRYIPYTEEELLQRQEEIKNTPEYRIAELEAALELLLSGAVE